MRAEKIALRAQPVALPAPDPHLDFLAGCQLPGLDVAYQLRHLRVARKPQRHQLTVRQRVDARLQIRRQNPRSRSRISSRITRSWTVSA